MDQMVLATQQWLNKTYGNDSRYNRVTEDGLTGWNTIYGLRRALQIEEGITATSNNFGPSTYSKCPDIKKGDSGNLVYIVQGGLWCKGYSPGGLNGNYGDGTYNAVQQFKSDAGFTDADGNMDKDFMKALLDMSAFTLLSGGTQAIRNIQQQLNRDYFDFYQICPCNGLYDRDMNKMLIYALQKELGISKSSATGSWGPTTISRCKNKNISIGKTDTVVKLIRYALVCNGYLASITSSTYDSTLDNVVSLFADDMILVKPSNGINYGIIKSLLSSNGDPDRSAIGCDTATQLTQEQIQAIKNAGYQFIGRYLTNVSGGINKKLTLSEVKNIYNAGLKLFPIFQESGNSASNFNSTTGAENANKAFKAAEDLEIPHKSVIYFAVDFDATDSEITNNVIPYFTSIVDSDLAFKYRVGVYGTRNVCNRLNKTLGIDKFFVADASYGYSGNLGYTMPQGWCFDQYAVEVSVGTNSGTVKIDKVAVSKRDGGVNRLGNDVGSTIRSLLKTFDLESKLDANINLNNEFSTVLEEYDNGDRVSLNVAHDIELQTTNSISFKSKSDFNNSVNEMFDSESMSLVFENVDPETKVQLKNEIRNLSTYIDNGNLMIGITGVNDQYQPGIIVSFALYFEFKDDDGNEHTARASLLFKRAGTVPFEINFRTEEIAKEARAAYAMAFTAIAIIYSPGLLAGLANCLKVAVTSAVETGLKILLSMGEIIGFSFA